MIHIDTEWALTSISQFQFWRNVPRAQFEDEEVRGVLSVDVSDWTAPGSDGRPPYSARVKKWCARRGISSSARSMSTRTSCATKTCTLGSWTRTSKTTPQHPGFLRNIEPLLVNLVDTWALRPEATTAIPNLFFASDYVRTYTDLATMEGANEAARRAVNGLLDALGFAGPRCDVWPLHEPEILTPWRLHDAARYEAGLPWDDSLLQVAAHAIRERLAAPRAGAPVA